jgi:hypothetical protein
MNDEILMHVCDGTADLPNKQGYSVKREAHSTFHLISVEMLIYVLISCELTDQINKLFIRKVSIEFSNVRMVHKGVNFDLTKYILFHF